MDAFNAGAGFSSSWLHTFLIVVTGSVVLIFAALLVVFLLHRLNEGILIEGPWAILQLLFLILTVVIVLGVLASM